MKAKLLVKLILFFSLTLILIASAGSSFTPQDYEGIKKKLDPEEEQQFEYDSIIQKVDPQKLQEIQTMVESFKDNPHFDISQKSIIEYFSKQGVKLSKEQLAQFYYEDLRGKHEKKCQVETEEGIYVLVSFGLNEDYLRNLVEEAFELNKEYKGKIQLIIQGFVKNSLKDTAKEIFKLMNGNPEKAAFSINPDIFRDFKVTKVPYFIFKDKDNVRTMSGAVSIKYFLEKLETTEENDIGVVGHTYSIAEKNFYDLIQERKHLAEQRLRQMAEKIQKESLIVKGYPSITPAKVTRSYKLDLTYTLPQDIINPVTGEVLFPKGYQVNPADYYALPKTIVINLDRKEEVDYLLKNIKNFEVIMVAKGDMGKFMLENKIRVFKLMPEIVDKLKISKTPSIIEQDGRLVKITEVALK